jgi:uncharacterized SAM-binding protein YcdF (DUF218 family)
LLRITDTKEFINGEGITQMLNTYDPVTMLQALNNTPRPMRFLRDLVFGGRSKTSVTEQVLVDIFKGKRRMAPFVSPYVGGKLMEREGYTTKMYTPPLIQPRDVLTPERLSQRAAGESIVSGRSAGDRAEVEQAEILNTFDDYITRREEWMLAQLLFTGTIHMVGEGVDESYSVGFTNTDTLSAAETWDETTCTPLADLETWRKTIIQSTGISPNTVIMAGNVVDEFVNNADVQKLLDVRRMEMGTINPSQLPNGATYIGSLSRLGVDIYQYDEYYVDDTTGLLAPMVPDGKLVMLADSKRNVGAQMLYGSWTEMDEGVTYEGERIPRVWSEKGANARIVEVVARPLPMIPDVDSWFVATVL